jgi:regulatory protein YycI of two-component signal transduction system YycFG
MKKNIKYLIVIIIFLIIAIFAWYLVFKKQIFNNSEININKQNTTATESITKVPTNTPQSVNSNPLGSATNDKEMTKEERTKFKIPASAKVEVLRRSESGIPTAYKIIK